MQGRQALFALLRNEVFETELNQQIKNFISSDNLYTLYQLSKKHDLAHLVADALDKNGLLLNDNPVSQKFLQQRVMAVYRYEQSNYELQEISRIFEEEKIENIPLKGSVLRAYYPQPWMRTSCDIDILVRQDEVKRAVKLLTEKYGYTYSIHTQHDYSLFSAGGVHIELHFILIFHDESGDDFTKRVWESAVAEDGFGYRKKLSNELFYGYHIAHIAQHILQGGCGVKPFIDLKIMQEKMSIDRFCAQETLERCHLTTFAQRCEELAEVWFDGGEKSAALTEFENYVLLGGVYGTLENKAQIGKSAKKGKFRYLLSRIFLPYRSLALMYPSLKKCPVLFPFYQVRRWFRLFHKNGVKVSDAVKELKTVSEVSEESGERAAALLRDLGLKQ